MAYLVPVTVKLNASYAEARIRPVQTSHQSKYITPFLRLLLDAEAAVQGGAAHAHRLGNRTKLNTLEQECAARPPNSEMHAAVQISVHHTCLVPRTEPAMSDRSYAGWQSCWSRRGASQTCARIQCGLRDCIGASLRVQCLFHMRTGG